MIETIARRCIFEHRDYIPGKPIEEVQKEFGLTDIVKLASNENPLGTSPKAVDAMVQEARTAAFRYPVSQCTALAEKLAARLGVQSAQIYLDNGEDAVITMLGLTFFSPEDEVIAADITFPAYENIAAKMGCHLVKVPLTDSGNYDLDGILRAVTGRTKAVFLCNPNNPTGRIVTRDQAELFAAQLPERVLLVMDEAYCDFADPDLYPDSIQMLPAHKNLIVLRTFSKLYGLAGVRCGYAVADAEIIRVMNKAREPFPVSRIAQAGAGAALDDTDFVRRTLANNRQGLQTLYKAFDAMGLAYYPSHANFVYVELGQDAEPIFQKMLRLGVIVRPLGGMGKKTAMRITVGLPEENEQLIRALRQALQE